VWSRGFNETTKGRLVSLLRRRSMTVEELAGELGVTDNAVRAQLASLERDDLVRQDGVRRGQGKPSACYSLVSGFETTLSRAYIPLLVRLLRELARNVPEVQIERMLHSLGRDWARDLPRPGKPPGAAAEVASGILNELGGVTEVVPVPGKHEVRGFSCPLAAAVKENPRVCLVIEALLSELLGVPVHEHCDRATERVRCCFEIAAEA
jgi:predicted ArsR family transcriptional regulator